MVEFVSGAGAASGQLRRSQRMPSTRCPDLPGRGTFRSLPAYTVSRPNMRAAAMWSAVYGVIGGPLLAGFLDHNLDDRREVSVVERDA